MVVDPPKDDALDILLQEITRNLGENQRFLQALKEDRIDEAGDLPPSEQEGDEFEEL